MKLFALLMVCLVGCSAVAGCNATDEHYFHRSTERRMIDLAAATKALSETHEIDDLDQLLRLAAVDGLIPEGDSESVRTDAWGTPFNVAREASGSILIRSAGEDQEFNTPDDILK